ncbi:MAG: phage tail sheath subtilisin-like domain-containing protein [Betaproteobacteria bacterium]|nr:phage tail sheath subtilisin-like domain-containing protein [Betaproteobacteria bacterium]
MSGIVQVPGYPTSNRVPGAYAKVDATKANTATAAQASLLIGQMLPDGSATPGVAVIDSGIGNAAAAYGVGSQLALAVERYRNIDQQGQLWVLPLADAGFVLKAASAQGVAGVTLDFEPSAFLNAIADGMEVSGADITAGTTVSGVDVATGVVTLSAATTAAVAAGASITFGASVAASGSITFTSAATSPSVLPLYVDGNYVPMSVNTGDTAATVATNLAVTLNAWSSAGGNPLSYTAAANASTVTLTARNAGSLQNSGTLVLSYGGPSAGEGQVGTTNVPGLTAAITGFSGGTTDPDLSTALANIPAQSFDFIFCPYSASTQLAAVTAFLSDATGRWNWASELFGGAFTGFGGTFAERTTWSTALNDQHLTAEGAYGSPNPDWHWGVDYCAAAAVSLRANPAVPVGGLGGGVALNVLPPQLANRDIFDEQNTLLYDGMSTYTVDSSGTVRVSRAITTYQKNAAGSPDNSYLDLNVPYQLAAYIRAWRTMITTNFNQAILVSDGTRIPPGSSMVTAATIETSIVAQYSQLATQGGYGLPAGIVSDAATFAQDIVVTNAGGGLLTCLLPVKLSSQLIVVAADVQFTRV